MVEDTKKNGFIPNGTKERNRHSCPLENYDGK